MDSGSRPSFWNIIEHEALPELVRCVNETYLPKFTIEDLELEFSENRTVSRSYGNGKIIFAPFNGGSEYAMYQDDKDLWASAGMVNKGSDYIEFKAWWLAAHELAHEVVDRVRKLCTEIDEPIITNVTRKILGDDCPVQKKGDIDLIDLVVNQAWWKRMGMYKSDTYSQRMYTLNYDDKAFKHGVFYQHIYRTLRRKVVNPKFGIHKWYSSLFPDEPPEESNWKQKSKPKQYPRNKNWFKNMNAQSPLDWMAEENGPALTQEEWGKRIDAHNTWMNNIRNAQIRRNEETLQKNLEKEREENQRRERIMGENNDTTPGSLIEKIKSQVHDEQIQIARDLVEREIVPLIKLAIEDDLDFIQLTFSQLEHWNLISTRASNEAEYRQFGAELMIVLSTYFQKFEYILIDENFDLDWFDDNDEDEDAMPCHVHRSNEVNSIICDLNAKMILQISW